MVQNIEKNAVVGKYNTEHSVGKKHRRECRVGTKYSIEHKWFYKIRTEHSGGTEHCSYPSGVTK